MNMDKLYDHLAHEKQAQELWAKEGVYAFTPGSAKEVYSIDTPPPTVSGTLHIGHVFSYTHADVIARYKRMKGFNVFYPMGFDDNGLPTERFVEKKNGTKAHLMKRSEFIDMCLRETHDVEKLFEVLWQRIGLSLDWSKTYSTISPRVRRISQYSFLELYKKGLVYRTEEPALYCTTCRTSVAQAELDSVQVNSTFNNIAFTTEAGEKLVIATTRPELLAACVAVFYHPDDDRYKHLDGTFAITPLYEKPVKLIPDATVDPAKGTGLVMCCTFGDQTDIQWYKTHKLPFVHIVGFDGKWTAVSGPLAGMTVHEARKTILLLLKEADALLDQKAITHAVSTHERCKQEIEYLVLHQWFINILDHKETFLALADKIVWKPEHMKARYRDWVQNLGWNWGISRQRFFGIPFPVWHCQDCSQVLLADPKSLPIDPQEQAFPGGACTACSSTNIEPDTDVMDTWNTSSLTPQINVNWPDASPDGLTMPMSMRPQAHDIIRTWTFDTIVKSYYHNGDIPWKTIVMSGHVLAGKEKISKSKENSKMTPEGLLAEYPADVIRYWSASGRLGADTAFSENQLKIGQRLITKLWNAFRFIAEHLAHSTRQGSLRVVGIDKQPFAPMEVPQAVSPAGDRIEGSEWRTPNPTDQLNQWILHALSGTYSSYQKHFDDYEYHSALEAAEKFFWQDFCDNYLELIKDRLFNPGNYTPALIDETKQTLYECGFGLLQLFAPFLPHITETLYQAFCKEYEQAVSVHITTFDNKRFAYRYDKATAAIAAVLNVVASVRKLKSEKQLSLKTELASLVICSTDQTVLNALKVHTTLLCGITKAQGIDFQMAASSSANATAGQAVEQGQIEGQEGALVARVGI